MKYCKYCGTKISDDVIFCPKCGKRQSNKNNINDTKANIKSNINIHTKPPITLNRGIDRDLHSQTINEYRKAIGFKNNTTNLAYVTLGSDALNAGVGAALGGVIGTTIGESTVDKFVMSVEKSGLLFLGLNSVKGRFNGRNKFILNKEISEAEISGSNVEFKINGNYFDIKIPFIVIGIGKYRKHVFNLINKRFNKNNNVNVDTTTTEDKPSHHVSQEEYHKQLQNNKISKRITFLVVLVVIFAFFILIGING